MGIEQVFPALCGHGGSRSEALGQPPSGLTLTSHTRPEGASTGCHALQRPPLHCPAVDTHPPAPHCSNPALAPWGGRARGAGRGPQGAQDEVPSTLGEWDQDPRTRSEGRMRTPGPWGEWGKDPKTSATWEKHRQDPGGSEQRPQGNRTRIPAPGGGARTAGPQLQGQAESGPQDHKGQSQDPESGLGGQEQPLRSPSPASVQPCSPGYSRPTCPGQT